MNNSLNDLHNIEQQSSVFWSRLIYHFWWLIPSFLILVSGVLFGYDITSAEPDLNKMIAGMVYGETSGQGIHAVGHYGLSFNFGYQTLLYAIAPIGSFQDFDHAARFFNKVGLYFSILLTLSTCWMTEKLFGKIMASAIVMAFLGSPIMLPFIISGHPMVAAMSLLFIGVCFLLLAEERSQSYQGSTLMVYALLSFVVGLTFRAEIALAFPFVAVASYYHAKDISRKPLVRLSLTAILLVLAFIIFLILQHPYVVNKGGAEGQLSSYIEKFFRISSLIKAMAIIPLGLGLFTSLITVGLITLSLTKSRFFKIDIKKDVSYIVIGLVLALPSLIFWVTSPSPERHFVLTIFGVYITIASLSKPILKTIPHAMLLGGLCIIANQILAEITYPIIEKNMTSQFGMPMHVRQASQLHTVGSFIADQRNNLQIEEIRRKEAIQLADTNPDQLIILLGSNRGYLLADLVARDHSLRITDTSLQYLRQKSGCLRMNPADFRSLENPVVD